jgi:hypothetical protein
MKNKGGGLKILHRSAFSKSLQAISKVTLEQLSSKTWVQQKN